MGQINVRWSVTLPNPFAPYLMRAYNVLSCDLSFQFLAFLNSWCCQVAVKLIKTGGINEAPYPTSMVMRWVVR